MAEEAQYVPTQEWIDSALAFDPALDWTPEQLAELHQTLLWLEAAYQDANGPTDANDFNTAYGTAVTQEWLNDFYGNPGTANMLANLIAGVESMQGLETSEAAAELLPRTVSPRSVSPRSRPASPRETAAVPARRRRGSVEAAAPSRQTAAPSRRASISPARRKRAKSPEPRVADADQEKRISGSLKNMGIKEADFWRYKIPGEDYAGDDPAGKREAIVNDLVKYYKDPFTHNKVSKINRVLALNSKVISKLHKAILRLDRAFSRYGKNVTLASTPEGARDAITATADDLAYLEVIHNERLKIIELYVRALRTRRPPAEKRNIDEFKASNTRILLTPEAINWIRNESFTIPDSVAVMRDGKKYTSLWAYLEDVIEVDKKDTFLYKYGLVTLGNYLKLLRAPLVKIPTAPLPALKKGEKRVPGPRRVAKYDYSAAMNKYFGGQSKATLDVVDNEKVENETGKSVLKLLADRAEGAGTPESFSTEEIPNSGVFILRAATHYPASTAKQMYADFFGPYAPDVHDAFIKESEAITAFYKAHSTNEASENKRLKAEDKLKQRQAKRNQLAARRRA